MSNGFPSLLQSFFTDRLFRQRRASPHTIAGYRDSFRLLFQFAKERLGKAPSDITLDDLNVPFIGISSMILKLAGRIALAPETSVWPRFIPSFSMWLSRSPPMRCFASDYSRCLLNVTSDGPSNSSTGKRSMRCWPPPIVPIGLGAAIGRCFHSLFRPGFGFPS